jgi:hypothetical protein
VLDLASFTFAFANVENLEKCTKVPLKLASGVELIPTHIQDQFDKGLQSLGLREFMLFFYTARCLVSNSLVEGEEGRALLISDFGCSLSFSCMRGYDEDPSSIKPWYPRNLQNTSATGIENPCSAFDSGSKLQSIRGGSWKSISCTAGFTACSGRLA